MFFKVCLLSYFFSKNFAEKAGFEPTIPFWGIRTFQARTFSHSVISPIPLPTNRLYHKQLTDFLPTHKRSFRALKPTRQNLLHVKNPRNIQFFFRNKKIYSFISPLKDVLNADFSASPLAPRPSINIIFVTAASKVISLPLTTPSSCIRRPVS